MPVATMAHAHSLVVRILLPVTIMVQQVVQTIHANTLAVLIQAQITTIQMRAATMALANMILSVVPTSWLVTITSSPLKMTALATTAATVVPMPKHVTSILALL
jgi:hypothetical protein